MPKFCAKNVFKKDKNYFKCLVWVTLPPSLDKFMFHFQFRVAVRLNDVKISDNSRMKLGQSHILVTADLAIDSKAQQSLWDKPEILDGKLTMRLGEMHLNMAFIAAIGKLFGDGGLLTGTEIYAEATARLTLQGKQYDRGVRGIRLVTEALLHLRNKSAEKWAVKMDGKNGMTVNICKDMEDDLVKVHETLDKFLFCGKTTIINIYLLG